jgi:hypothetical protein
MLGPSFGRNSWNGTSLLSLPPQTRIVILNEAKGLSSFGSLTARAPVALAFMLVQFHLLQFSCAPAELRATV